MELTEECAPIVVVSHYLSVDGFAGLVEALRAAASQTALLVLTDGNACMAATKGLPSEIITSFESFILDASQLKLTLGDLRDRYSSVPWNSVVASERSFTDYSFLMGATGHRFERDSYIVPLILNLVSFFDAEFERLKPRAVITARGDNLFTFIAAIVAEEKGIPLLIPHPAFLNENGGLEAGYFGNTPFLESFSMVRHYLELKARSLTDSERARAEAFSASLIAYDGRITLEHYYKKKDFERPVTPQRNRLLRYIREQNCLDSTVAFYKIDWRRKVGANFRRIFRQYRARHFLASQIADVPEESVFFAMHFQPEASTLVNGIWYSNQIALIETLSKALPLGYTLIVKEHPRGRGMRPFWQYEHIANLHNVQFCDLPSKEILGHCKMAVSISGSIGLEALAMKKPVLMFGRTFHTFHPLYYRVGCPEDLPSLLHGVLIDGHFQKREALEEEIHRILLAYLNAMYPFSPIGKRMADLTTHLLDELDQPMDVAREWLNRLHDDRSSIQKD